MVRLAYTDLPLGLVATCLVAMPLAWVMTPTHGSVVVWGWLAWMVGLSFVRHADVRRFQLQARDDATAVAWAGWFTAGAVASGIGWGYAG
jgi:hypothetical protein